MAVWSSNKAFIFQSVEAMYRDVARHPEMQFHFPTGRLACLFVGYPAEQLDRIPGGATESFAGVSNPFLTDVIRPGDTVLDIGSGSGTDTLIAANLTGPSGKVYALDMTDAMREKLQGNVASMKIEHVEIIAGNAEKLTLPDASVDVVTSNGVLNLVPDKAAAFAEIARVLRPGGRLQLSDIVLRTQVSESSMSDPKLWAECVVGAVVVDDYLAMLRTAGLEVEKVSELDYFAGSISETTRRVAKRLGAHAIVLRGHRR